MDDQTNLFGSTLYQAEQDLAAIRRRYSNEQIDLYFLRPEPRSLEELAIKFRDQFVGARTPLICLGIAIACLIVFVSSKLGISYIGILLLIGLLSATAVSTRWLILMFKRDIVPSGREFYEEYEEFQKERAKWQRVKPPTEAEFEDWIKDLREKVFAQAPAKLYLEKSVEYKKWEKKLKNWNARQMPQATGYGAGYRESNVGVPHPGRVPEKEWDFVQQLGLEGFSSPKYRSKLAEAGHEDLLQGTRELSEHCRYAVSRHLWITNMLRFLPFLGESDIEKTQRHKLKEERKEEKDKQLRELVVGSIMEDKSIPVGRRTRLPGNRWHYSHYEFTRLFVTISYIAIYTYNINVRTPDTEDELFEHFYHEHLSYISVRNTTLNIGEDVIKGSNVLMLLDNGHPITKTVAAVHRGGESITGVDGMHEQLLKALRPHKMSMKHTLDERDERFTGGLSAADEIATENMFDQSDERFSGDSSSGEAMSMENTLAQRDERSNEDSSSGEENTTKDMLDKRDEGSNGDSSSGEG